MNRPVEIRASRFSDLPAIRDLAVRSGLFAEHEAADVVASVEVAEDEPALWLTAVGDDDVVVGAMFAGRELVSDRVWNMFFLAVEPARRRGGIGRALVAAMESRLVAREDGATAVVIETSSVDAYASARRFYAGQGYSRVGEVPDYYGPRDNKVILWKRLA